MTTTMFGAGPGARRSMGRIGLWGPPGSGKTTFLAALNIAVLQSPDKQIRLFGSDTDSTVFLKESTAMLTRDRTFPDATEAGKQLSWVLSMDQQIQVPAKLFGKKPATVTVDLNLDLLDEPGDRFSDRPKVATGGDDDDSGLGFDNDDDDPVSESSENSAESVMDQLSGCNGLVLLFDPTREWEEGDMFNYFQGTLLEIAQRRMMGRTEAGGRLPHYVAVCVTKFDHPDVYRRARRLGYRSFSPYDPHLFPRVPDEFAEEFFVSLVREADKGNAELVPNALRRFFLPERIQFFVTSAIGFHLNKSSSRFQEADSMNLAPKPGGGHLIRGPIHPINVVEPLIWLGEHLAGGSR
jgi:energy-coupling factor transporter ATP-binding protein EcfA2